MWREMNIKFTPEEVIAFKIELDTGSLAIANRFKNFIIQNANPQEKMTLKVDNEEFKVECNKHYNVGEITNKFDLFDTKTNSIRRVHNTETVKKPNLPAFRLFFPTGLVHNIDSQIEDNTADAVMDAYGFCIPIHDAQVLCCEATDYARDVYCSGRNKTEPSLERTYRERKNILGKYFTSIGIERSKITSWKEDVEAFIEPYKGQFKCNRIVLK